MRCVPIPRNEERIILQHKNGSWYAYQSQHIVTMLEKAVQDAFSFLGNETLTPLFITHTCIQTRFHPSSLSPYRGFPSSSFFFSVFCELRTKRSVEIYRDKKLHPLLHRPLRHWLRTEMYSTFISIHHRERNQPVY